MPSFYSSLTNTLSGAGKSTVLHALAGRIKDSSKLKLYGRRFINGNEVDGDSMLPSAFIEQDVNFFPHMTVRETLAFRIHLKLGSRLDKKARDEMAHDLMKQLGLLNAADTVVGSTKIRGISGGERKRLSIAVELISSPSLIFLDEPTRYARIRATVGVCLYDLFLPVEFLTLLVCVVPADWTRLRLPSWSLPCVTWPMLERRLSPSFTNPVSTCLTNLMMYSL